MKRLFAIFAAALALCGCSTTYLQRTLDKGEYADAYKMVFAAGPNSSLFEERQKTTANIRDKTGGEGGNSFAKSLSNFITGSNWTPTLAEDFLQVKQMLDTALTDRLISRLQHKDLMDELLFRLANDSISKPSLLTKNARAEFPEAEKYRTKIALSEIEKLQADPSANLNRYITLYSFFVEVKEPVATQRVKAAMQGKVTLQMQQPGGLQNVDAGQAIVDYIKLTGDHSFDTLFITALSKINLSKNELTTGYIPEMFPAFSIDEVKKRTIRLNIASQNDEFIVCYVPH